MPVKVTCTTCEKVINAPDAARGKAIRCPECQTKIAVPAESAAPKAVAAGAKKRKPAAEALEEADSEHAFANLDFRKAEDKNARICPKCGFDMKYQDEDDNECPECGFDSSVGGMGAKARKRAMKGPDPADFYPGLFKSSWKFVRKNISLAWRTVVYTLISLTFSVFCAFMYLWVSAWPPRAFLALCFTVSFLVIPGWLWVLDVETIKLSLERKDKFKRLNFDFFLSSAMGVAFCAWCAAVIAPIVLIPAGIGYYFMSRMDDPRAVLVIPLCMTLGLIPSILMLPVAMSHMAMIVPTKGWMVWELVPAVGRNIKALLLWFLLFVMMNIPTVAGLATIAVVSGPGLVKMVQVMEYNADQARKKFAATLNPNAQKRGQPAAAIQVLPEEPKEVDFQPLIIPCVILAVMAVINGFTSLFLMRVNGQFTYYNKNYLGLVDRRKEKKYVSVEPEDENNPKEKTMALLWGDAFAFFLIFDLLGFVFGFMYGWFTTNVGQMDGVYTGIAYGFSGGHAIGLAAAYVMSAVVAFQTSPMWGLITLFGLYPVGFFVYAAQDFSERKSHIMRVIAGVAIAFIVAAITILILPAKEEDPAAMQAPPAAEAAENPPNGAAANPAAPAGK